MKVVLGYEVDVLRFIDWILSENAGIFTRTFYTVAIVHIWHFLKIFNPIEEHSVTYEYNKSKKKSPDLKSIIRAYYF